MYPPELEGIEELSNGPEALCHGGSAISFSMEDYLAGPLFDQEGTLAADLDMTEVRGRYKLDCMGHCARPDMFRLLVNKNPMPAVVTKPEQ